jgi:DNA-directed RNA polymerase specialized sigma subunit
VIHKAAGRGVNMPEEVKEEVKSENEIKKEYLKSFMPKQRAAKRLEEEIAQLRLDKMLPSMSYDDMPHASNMSDLSDYMAKFDDLMTELIKARRDRIVTYMMIFTDIEQMEDEKEKELLTLRYLKGYGWEAVCVEMNYSWKQIHRIHASALKNFKMTLNDTQKAC